MIYFTATSNIFFAESIQNASMTIDLQLTNNSSLVLDSVKCLSDSLDFVPSLVFHISLTEEQVRKLYKNPIETFTAKGILTTTFTKKKVKFY